MEMRSSLIRIGLPSPTTEKPLREARVIQREMDYDAQQQKEKYEIMYELLNVDQRTVFDKIKQTIDQKQGGYIYIIQKSFICRTSFVLRVYFLDAPGGCGKTFLIRCILAYVRSKSEIALGIIILKLQTDFHTI